MTNDDSMTLCCIPRTSPDQRRTGRSLSSKLRHRLHRFVSSKARPAIIGLHRFVSFKAPLALIGLEKFK
jgi:hypothetical protein